MRVNQILKCNRKEKSDLYFVKFSNGSVGVFSRKIYTRIAQNNNSLYRLWMSNSPDNLKLNEKDERLENIDSLPEGFYRENVDLYQGATEEHVESILQFKNT